MVKGREEANEIGFASPLPASSILWANVGFETENLFVRFMGGAFQD